MLHGVRDVLYGASILAALGLVYVSLGTLNGRIGGGFTARNLPLAVCGGVFVVATLGGVICKALLRARRRRQTVYRSHPSGRGWVRSSDRIDD